MNNVINELKAERDELRNRLKKIEAAIEEYERWARSVADLMGDEKSRSAQEPVTGPVAEQTPIATFEKEVRALFGRVAAPLKRADVYEELSTAGVVVGGKDPLNTIAARLSRMEGVTNLKGHGYWAADRPYPPAGYPEDTSDTDTLFGGPSAGAATDTDGSGAES